MKKIKNKNQKSQNNVEKYVKIDVKYDKNH